MGDTITGIQGQYTWYTQLELGLGFSRSLYHWKGKFLLLLQKKKCTKKFLFACKLSVMKPIHAPWNFNVWKFWQGMYLDQKSLVNKGFINGHENKEMGPSARVANQNTGFTSLACSRIQLYHKYAEYCCSIFISINLVLWGSLTS